MDEWGVRISGFEHLFDHTFVRCDILNNRELAFQIPSRVFYHLGTIINSRSWLRWQIDFRKRVQRHVLFLSDSVVHCCVLLLKY